MDDSGTRNPDRKPGRRAAHGYDYFSLGGILVNEENEQHVRRMHEDFIQRWKIQSPLHSAEVRARSKAFSWVGQLSEEDQLRFYEELYILMRDIPVLGIAAVIDRPGCLSRYPGIKESKRWLFCKTVFPILIERAVKHAKRRDRKLRIYMERCSKKDDQILKNYYEELRTDGAPFLDSTSLKYSPIDAAGYKAVLSGLEFKYKTSPMVQLADLYLWPMSMGGFDDKNRPYARLLGDGKLVDSHIREEERMTMGIKYSCMGLAAK